ncbi:hypothetical protein [Mycobacteroides abscessus]|uniref:hypothetical protein n=1 Tax=Mycobacteroides abscessus TaxID=36809 RepID=UPI0012FFDC9E|nr:hypothetical protein [Mycobacteroides abscessus]
MRIKTDNGAGIFLSERRDHGVTIQQGKSHIWLSASEALAVAEGLQQIAKGEK